MKEKILGSLPLAACRLKLAARGLPLVACGLQLAARRLKLAACSFRSLALDACSLSLGALDKMLSVLVMQGRYIHGKIRISCALLSAGHMLHS